YVCGFLRWLFQRQAENRGNLHRISQGATDGAIARFYTRQEWRGTVRGVFEVEAMQGYGLKSSIVPLPHGRLKKFLEDTVPDSVARILTHHLRGGTFLIAQMRPL